MEKIIVLITKGKNNIFATLSIKLFDDRWTAELFCKETSDDESFDEKYWTYAEIIKENLEYEPSRYINY